MKLESLSSFINSLICSFILYLDIVFMVLNNSFAVDFFILFISILLLHIICYKNESLIFHIITLVISCLPVVVFVINLIVDGFDFNFEPDFFQFVRFLSEIILFVPVYFLQGRKICKMYRNEIC